MRLHTALHVTLAPVNTTPGNVQVEMTFEAPDSGTATLEANLYGGTLGIMLSKNRAQRPVPAMTKASYLSSVYGKAFAGVAVKTPPRKFPIVDRFIAGDDDLANLKNGTWQWCWFAARASLCVLLTTSDVCRPSPMVACAIMLMCWLMCWRFVRLSYARTRSVPTEPHAC